MRSGRIMGGKHGNPRDRREGFSVQDTAPGSTLYASLGASQAPFGQRRLVVTTFNFKSSGVMVRAKSGD